MIRRGQDDRHSVQTDRVVCVGGDPVADVTTSMPIWRRSIINSAGRVRRVWFGIWQV